jgi:AraC-like DNA-binding protein
MTRNEIQDRLRIAATETIADLHKIADEMPASELAALLRYVAAHLFEPDLTVASALRGAEVTDAAAPARLAAHLGRGLREDIAQRRIRVAQRMRQPDQMPTGRVAAAVGIPAEKTFRRAWRRHTGEALRVFRFTPLLCPDFNYATWNRIRRRNLPVDDARRLLERLHRLAAIGTHMHETDRTEIRQPAFTPVLGHDARRVWQLAAGEVLDAVRRDRQGLPVVLDRFFRALEARLYDPEFSVAAVCAAVGARASTLAPLFLFYQGQTVAHYVDRRRVETSLRLLAETAMTIRDAAAAVGLDDRRFRRIFKETTGELPAAARTIPEQNNAVDEGLWRRVGRGQATGSEMADVARWIADSHPDAFTLEERRIETRPTDPADAATTTPRQLAARSEEPTNEENDRAEVALILSRKTGTARRRRAIERFLGESAAAPNLYRIREIQCAVTAAEQLDHGRMPRGELWAEWLKVRARTHGGGEARTADWKAIETQLTDATTALNRWREADARRRRLTRKTDNEKQRVLDDEGSEFRCYLVAKTCLDAERRHRGAGTQGIEETKTALAIAESLFGDLVAGVEPPRRRAPSAGTDLLVLCRARLANAERIHGDIRVAHQAIGRAFEIRERVRLGDYVEAELSSLYASVLKDEGLQLALAETHVDYAIGIFSTFDVHLAARARIKKAAIRRLQAKDYLNTLAEATHTMDDRRDPSILEAAETNLLFYTVKEGEFDLARLRRRSLPLPTDPAHRAFRIGVEGCIDLALGNVNNGKDLLFEARDRFIDLKRYRDAEIAALYLAEAYCTEGDMENACRLLRIASSYARSSGYPEAAAIEELVEKAGKIDRPVFRIRKIAYQAGGCLGPEEPRHGRINRQGRSRES